ncbi:MAG: hypothetical protein JKX67_00515 [Colwellia sp.]|nr:hypothetical protein [Colwellia sp.]
MTNLIEEPNVTFDKLMEGETYFLLLQKIADAINTSVAGYNQQIQAGEDAATALQACQAALIANLEASATHLPLQSGQANKVLKSQGQGGQAVWGGDWQVKTADFNAVQLDTIITKATVTPIDITLITPEAVGMHIIIRNSLLSTEPVTVINATGQFLGQYDTFEQGEDIIIMPGETLQVIAMDLTANAEIWEFM